MKISPPIWIALSIFMWCTQQGVSPKDEKGPSPCYAKGDIIVAVDVSDNLAGGNLEEKIDFAVDLIMKMGNFVHPNRGFQIGAVSFAFESRVFGFFPEMSTRQLIAVLLDAEQEKSASLVHLAIEAATNVMRKDGRAGAVRIIVVITDSMKSIYPKAIEHSVRIARQSPIEIISVGIGVDIPLSVLSLIATQSDNVFTNPGIKPIFDKIATIVSANKTGAAVFNATDYDEDYDEVDRRVEDDEHKEQDGTLHDETLDTRRCDVIHIMIAIDSSETFLSDEFNKEKELARELIKKLVESLIKSSHIIVDLFQFSDAIHMYMVKDASDPGAVDTVIGSLTHIRGGKDLVNTLESMADRSDWVGSNFHTFFVILTDGMMPNLDVEKSLVALRRLIDMHGYIIFVKSGMSRTSQFWGRLKDELKIVAIVDSDTEDIIKSIKDYPCADKTDDEVDVSGCVFFEINTFVIPAKTITGREPTSLSLSLVYNLWNFITQLRHRRRNAPVYLALLPRPRQTVDKLKQLLKTKLNKILDGVDILNKNKSQLFKLETLLSNSSDKVQVLLDVLRNDITQVSSLEKIVVMAFSSDKYIILINAQSNRVRGAKVNVHGGVFRKHKSIAIAVTVKYRSPQCIEEKQKHDICGPDVHRVALAVDLSAQSQIVVVKTILKDIRSTRNYNLTNIYPYNHKSLSQLETVDIPTSWLDTLDYSVLPQDLPHAIRTLGKTLLINGGTSIHYIVILAADGWLIDRPTAQSVESLKPLGVFTIFVSNNTRDLLRLKNVSINVLEPNEHIVDKMSSIENACVRDNNDKRSYVKDALSSLFQIVIAIDVSETFMPADLEAELNNVREYISHVVDMDLLQSISAITTYGDSTSVVRLKNTNVSAFSLIRHIHSTLAGIDSTRGGKNYNLLIREFKKMLVRSKRDKGVEKIAVVFTDGMVPRHEVFALIGVFRQLVRQGLRILFVKTGFFSYSSMWSELRANNLIEGDNVSTAVALTQQLLSRKSDFVKRILSNESRIDLVIDRNSANDLEICWNVDFKAYNTVFVNFGMFPQFFVVDKLYSRRWRKSNFEAHVGILGASPLIKLSEFFEYLSASRTEEPTDLVLIQLKQSEVKTDNFTQQLFRQACRRVRAIAMVIMRDTDASTVDACRPFTEITLLSPECLVYCYTVDTDECRHFGLFPIIIQSFVLVEETVLSNSNVHVNEIQDDAPAGAKCSKMVTLAFHSKWVLTNTRFLDEYVAFTDNLFELNKKCTDVLYFEYIFGKSHVLDKSLRRNSWDRKRRVDHIVNIMDLHVLLNDMSRAKITECERNIYAVYTSNEDLMLPSDLIETIRQIYRIIDRNRENSDDRRYSLIIYTDRYTSLDRYFTTRTEARVYSNYGKTAGEVDKLVLAMKRAMSNNTCYRRQNRARKRLRRSTFLRKHDGFHHNQREKDIFSDSKPSHASADRVMYTIPMPEFITEENPCTIAVLFISLSTEISAHGSVYDVIHDVLKQLPSDQCSVKLAIFIENEQFHLADVTRVLTNYSAYIDNPVHSNSSVANISLIRKIEHASVACQNVVFVLFAGNNPNSAIKQLQYELILLSARRIYQSYTILYGANVVPFFKYLSTTKRFSVAGESTGDMCKELNRAIGDICGAPRPTSHTKTNSSENMTIIDDEFTYSLIEDDTDHFTRNCTIGVVVVDALMDNINFSTMYNKTKTLLAQFWNESYCSEVRLAFFPYNTSRRFVKVGEFLKDASHIDRAPITNIYILIQTIKDLLEHPLWECDRRGILLSLHGEITRTDRVIVDYEIERLTKTLANVSILLSAKGDEGPDGIATTVGNSKYTYTNDDGIVHRWIEDNIIKNSCLETDNALEKELGVENVTTFVASQTRTATGVAPGSFDFNEIPSDNGIEEKQQECRVGIAYSGPPMYVHIKQIISDVYNSHFNNCEIMVAPNDYVHFIPLKHLMLNNDRSDYQYGSDDMLDFRTTWMCKVNIHIVVDRGFGGIFNYITKSDRNLRKKIALILIHNPNVPLNYVDNSSSLVFLFPYNDRSIAPKVIDLTKNACR